MVRIFQMSFKKNLTQIEIATLTGKSSIHKTNFLTGPAVIVTKLIGTSQTKLILFLQLWTQMPFYSTFDRQTGHSFFKINQFVMQSMWKSWSHGRFSSKSFESKSVMHIVQDLSEIIKGFTLFMGIFDYIIWLTFFTAVILLKIQKYFPRKSINLGYHHGFSNRTGQF